jgi:hypothetical protein
MLVKETPLATGVGTAYVVEREPVPRAPVPLPPQQ